MGSALINRIVDDFSHLKLDDKEYTADILKKQFVEAKREAISKRAREAITNMKRGDVKKGNIKDLHRDLESD